MGFIIKKRFDFDILLITNYFVSSVCFCVYKSATKPEFKYSDLNLKTETYSGINHQKGFIFALYINA
jgi:hypothetical protein